MGHEDAGHYARKHWPGSVADPTIREAIEKRAANGKLPCAVAFDVAKRLGVAPHEVGRTADLMEIRLVKCQLGLFGYSPKKSIVEPAASVAPAVEKEILQAIINGRLPCKRAWEIADQLGIHKMKVSAACDALVVRIRPCQLGAF
ncbi:MAG: hypothetical protein HWN68_04585 [Desulfobacterales bacterium]|nr:hypothetical protein [Desulfobacterales bacterium]